MNSIKLGLNYDIAFLLDNDFFFFKLVILFFMIFLELEQKLLGLLEFFSSVGLALCLIFLLGLLLLFEEFILVVLFTSVFGTKDSFQICISLFLVEYDGGMSLTALVVVVFLVSVLVWVHVFRFTHSLFESFLLVYFIIINLLWSMLYNQSFLLYYKINKISIVSNQNH